MSEKERLALMWVIAALTFALGIWVCLGKGHRVPMPTQGQGAKDLIDGLNGGNTVLVMLEIPTAEVVAPKITYYYFAATATDNAGLESDYSNEAIYVRTSRVSQVTLAWDASQSTNSITNYKVYMGGATMVYTNSLSAGTNLSLAVAFVPPYLSNIVFNVTTVEATNLQWTASLRGKWYNLNATNWTTTNPSSPRFFRALAKKAGSRVNISTWRY